MKIIVLIAAIILVAGALLSGIVLAEQDAVKSLTYNAWTDLSLSELIDKGWVPTDFPGNTVNIKVTMDMDHSETWIACNYTDSLPEPYTSNLQAADDSIQKKLSGLLFFRLKKQVDFKVLDSLEYVGVDEKNKMLYYYKKSEQPLASPFAPRFNFGDFWARICSFPAK